MKSDRIRIFQSLEHPCGYFPQRPSRNLVIDPLARGLPQAYGSAVEKGFRRSGGHVYRPHCAGCRACVAARVEVAQFRPDRSQRRTLARNADLEVAARPARRSDEHFALYRRYLKARHADGGMDDPGEDDFDRFLAAPWSPTQFVEFRLHGELLAVAVTDVLPQGLSAVYTFFDPSHAARSLGTHAILRQIELAKLNGLAYLYLGYWIAGHPKMDYKARFRPLQVLGEHGWAPHENGPCD